MKTDIRQTTFTKKRYDGASKIYNLLEWPMEQVWYKKWRKILWERVKGPEVLEIGVGTGKNLPYYSEELSITAIDLSPGMLKFAHQKLDEEKNANVSLKEMDAQNLKFGNDTFDEVVATFVFCSVPDPILGLKEALRVTKTGGSLHLLEHMRSRNSILAAVMDKLDKPVHSLIGVHIARETVVNVEKAGWKLRNVQDLIPSGVFRMIEAEKPV